MRRLPFFVVPAALAGALAIGVSLASVHLAALAPQAPTKSPDGKIWDGAFTAAQADRGQQNFTKGPCAGCHLPDLSGDRGPTLKGDSFVAHWENGSINELFVKIRDTMPPNASAALTDEQKLDVVAFLLRSNGFPTGTEELTSDPEELDAIQIVRKGASLRGAPNFTLVHVVGCLTQGSDNAWMLTKTSEPVATKDDVSAAAALKLAEAQALGTQTYQLVSVSTSFNVDAHKGQKVEARGLLYRAPNDNRLNLTSLQPVASICSN